MEGDDQFPDHSPMLSLSPPFSEDSVIEAQPIIYCLPPEPSSSSGQDSENPSDLTLSLFPQVSENASKPTPSLFSEFSVNTSDPNLSMSLHVPENPSKPTLSLFPQISGNLASSKLIGNNTPSLPSTDLRLSAPDTSSTITTLQCSMDSSDIASSSREVNALGNPASKRPLFQELGEEKFVPIKKIKLGKESTSNPTRQEAAGEEGHWITKKLTKSDVNGASRLLLPRKDVNKYILPFMGEEDKSIISQHLGGVDVVVFDMDTQTTHELTLKKWSTNSFQLVKAWTVDFVERRNLKENDVISIRWEKDNSRFCFRVHMRNPLDDD